MTEELDYQPHITDDPDVWGLADIALGRRTLVPQTIYVTAGDNASGVAGLLTVGGEFIPCPPSGAGRTIRLVGDWYGVNPVKGEPATAFDVVWDGSKKVPGEHSKGILLGDYQIRNEFRKAQNRKATVSRHDFDTWTAEAA